MSEERSPWLKAKAGAAHGDVSVKQIYRAVRTGALKAARVGGRREIRVRREEIDRWLDRLAQ